MTIVPISIGAAVFVLLSVVLSSFKIGVLLVVRVRVVFFFAQCLGAALSLVFGLLNVGVDEPVKKTLFHCLLGNNAPNFR